jgi:hypothetical protein
LGKILLLKQTRKRGERVIENIRERGNTRSAYTFLVYKYGNFEIRKSKFPHVAHSCVSMISPTIK